MDLATTPTGVRLGTSTVAGVTGPALVGSLSQPGFWKVAVSVTDGGGTSVSAILNIGVSLLRDLDSFIPAQPGQFIRVAPRITGGTSPYQITLSSTTYLPLGIQFNPQTNEFYGTTAIPHGFGVSVDINDSRGNILRTVIGFGPTSGPSSNLSYGVLVESGACGDLNVRTQTNNVVSANIDWGDGASGMIAFGTVSTHHNYDHDGTFSLRFFVPEAASGVIYRGGYEIQIANRNHELCQLSLRLQPSAVYLVHGNTTGTFRLDSRSRQGDYYPLDMSRFAWSTLTPALVDIDQQGNVTCSGIGEARVELVAKELEWRVPARVYCGEYGLEPALLQLSPMSGNNTAQLSVQGILPNGQHVPVDSGSVQFSVGPASKADLISLTIGGNLTVRRGPTAQSEKVTVYGVTNGINVRNNSTVRVATTNVGLSIKPWRGAMSLSGIPITWRLLTIRTFWKSMTRFGSWT